MFMACHMRDGITLCQVMAQGCQSGVLDVFKTVSFQAFQLNAYRVIIALAASPVERCARMPCPLIAVHKLPEAAIACNEKMG